MKKTEFYSQRVQYLSVEQIRPNSQQPRREFDQKKLDSVKGSLLRKNASAFETNNSLVNLLVNIRNNKLADDYVAKEEAVVNAMTLEDLKAKAADYLDINKMIIVVVGDAATQLKNVPNAKLIPAI